MTDTGSALQDETLLNQQSSKTYLSARENMNQTQNFVPRDHLVRGSAKDNTRNVQKMTIELHNDKKNDPLSKTQKYSQGSLKTNVALPDSGTHQRAD